MVDINAEAQSALEGVNCDTVYYYPDDFTVLPVISYYNISETPAFSSDNDEIIQTGTVVIDIWGKVPSEIGTIAIEVNEVMTADGWGREYSRDMPLDDSRVYHKTMRYSKDFIVS